MKYRAYPHEALKKAVAGALGAAHLDFSKLMSEPMVVHDDEDIPYVANRMTLVAALGMGIRSGGVFSREEVQALQRRAVKGHRGSQHALRAMQAERPIDRTKHLGVLLWRIKFMGETGPEVFLAAAHILAEVLRKRTGVGKRPLGSRYVAVMQCALTEWLHDRCLDCSGTGESGRSAKAAGRNHPALYTCGACGGTGAYAPGNVQRAQALYMDVSTFMEKWAVKYERVLSTLEAIDRKTGQSVDRQVRRDYAATDS